MTIQSRLILYITAALLLCALNAVPGYAIKKPLLPDIAPIATPETPEIEAVPKPVVPTAEPAAAATSVAKDTCAAYIDSAENYARCKIQLVRIQRMIDARNQREQGENPVTQPATSTSPTDTPDRAEDSATPNATTQLAHPPAAPAYSTP